LKVSGPAEIQRTVIVVALLVTAGTGASAREFGAADTRNAMMRARGAAPVELLYSQVLTGLATSPIDGAETNWPSFVTTDHYEHPGHDTRTEHTISPEFLVMSTAWETLPPGGRNLLREQTRRSSQFERIRKVE
jgi:TRAP-type C4-dicarboxylate transport system substrate-binding protein